MVSSRGRVRGLVVGGEHEQADGRVEGVDLLGDAQALLVAAPGVQAHVEDHDLRVGVADEVDELAPGGDVADHVDARRREQQAQRRPEEPRVVQHGYLHGSSATRTVPPSRRSSTVSSPSSARSRSRRPVSPCRSRRGRRRDRRR